MWLLLRGGSLVQLFLSSKQNKGAFIVLSLMQMTLHHQWLPAPLSRIGRIAPAYQTGKSITRPCLRRRKLYQFPGMAAVLTTRLRTSFPRFSLVAPSSTSWRLQVVIFITFPNEIETWCTRKLPPDVPYWMKTWWACSPNVLAVSGFIMTAP